MTSCRSSGNFEWLLQTQIRHALQDFPGPACEAPPFRKICDPPGRVRCLPRGVRSIPTCPASSIAAVTSNRSPETRGKAPWRCSPICSGVRRPAIRPAPSQTDSLDHQHRPARGSTVGTSGVVSGRSAGRPRRSVPRFALFLLSGGRNSGDPTASEMPAHGRMFFNVAVIGVSHRMTCRQSHISFGKSRVLDSGHHAASLPPVPRRGSYEIMLYAIF